MKRAISLLVLFSLIFTPALADTEKDGFHFDDRGFLTGDANPADEYILEDEENGLWQYASKNLSITVTRYRETVKTKKGNRVREYCVAEIYTSPASPLSAITNETPKGKKERVPGYYKDYPEELVRRYPAVLAISDDYYGHREQTRISNPEKFKWPDGIIIRNGELISDKTRKKGKVEFPPLDTLAVFPDGSMRTDPVAEKTAEDFLAEGAVQVFAFGPWLIHEGMINEKGVDSTKSYMYNTARYSEPRVAIGMAEPFHYFAIVVKGRPDSKYIGAKFDWLAEKMLELGCTEALNLDGGETACMVFNGKTIMQGVHGKKGVRALGSMIAFGLK